MSMTQEEIDELISSGNIDEEAEKVEEKKEDEQEGKQTEDAGKAQDAEIGEGESVYSPLDPKLELLLDIQLPVSIELGRTSMLIRNILRLGRGSVIEFEKQVSEPVDVLINGKKIAEGEVVVIDKHFGLRITTLVDPSDRLRAINK